MYIRRSFLQQMAAATEDWLLPRTAWSRTHQDPGPSNNLLPLRRLGRTHEPVTMLGLGGGHLVERIHDEDVARRVIEAALAEGVRFFDTAEGYGKGKSEQLLGRYLVPGNREQIYLMTKTGARDADAAREHLAASLRRLKTDHLDLWQMHSLNSADDAEQRLNQGVVDAMLEAREQGKVRHLGFTGHTTPAAHRRMLELLAERGLDFDACQMVINVLDPGYESFIEQVMPILVERNYGILAMKSLAFGQLLGMATSWDKERDETPPALVPERISLAEALHFVWSLPVSVLISGVETPEQLRENAQFARSFETLDTEARERVLARVAEFAGPSIEFYKRDIRT